MKILKRTYVLVGTGLRAYMYIRAIKETHADCSELLGFYDINPGRAQTVGDEFGVPVFDDFEKMINQTHPDRVIVTCVDAFHS